MLTRKWWIIICIGTVVIGLGLGLGLWLGLRGPGVDLSSPIATVDSALDAREAQDAGRCADCCHFPLTLDNLDNESLDRESFISRLNFAFGFIDSSEISDIDKEVTAETEDTATVEASYHVRDVSADGTDEYDETDIYGLVKIGDNWYITSISIV
jgi:hypothetical protein